MTRKRPAVEVEVTTHAREQARARFPGFKAARIVDEVRTALCEGRVSVQSPNGVGPVEEKLLYAWTADEVRLYTLRAKEHAYLVTTTLYGPAMRVA